MDLLHFLTKITPVVAIATKDSTYDKMLANIGEVKARGPQVIAIADEDDTEIEKHADFVLRYPSNSDILSCIPIISNSSTTCLSCCKPKWMLY